MISNIFKFVIGITCLGMTETIPFKNYPNNDTIEPQNKILKYYNDSAFSEVIKTHLKKNKVKFGTVLVSDLKTGNIISIVEVNKGKISNKPNLSFSSDYPAASIVKIITAASAIGNNSKYVYEDIPHKGAYHAFFVRRFLYMPVKLRDRVSLEYAFANSINLSFGLIGNDVGMESLTEYAEKFNFNKKSNLDNVSVSNYEACCDSLKIAMSASGFTKDVTLSPIHALEIARAIGSDGNYKYSSFYEGQVIPTPTKIFNDSNLLKMQRYMAATVEYGTAEGGFKRTITDMGNVAAGGKTGNLSGDLPMGRYTWFVGYANNEFSGIAISVMLLNQRSTKTTAVKTSAVIVKNWFQLN